MSSDCLATIEAIYYFIREYHEGTKKLPYDGQYDSTSSSPCSRLCMRCLTRAQTDLLWFYVYTYNLIQNRYKYVSLVHSLLRCLHGAAILLPRIYLYYRVVGKTIESFTRLKATSSSK